MDKKLHVNNTFIKITAMVTMLIDHIGILLNAFMPHMLYMVLRGIGRISFPLFAFCIAEGFYHTSSEGRYLVRIALFAFLSEIPFNIFISGKIIYTDKCNVLFTFAIAIIVLWILRYCDHIGRKAGAAKLLAVIAGMAAAYMIKSDYSFTGVALIVIIYYTRFNRYAGYAASTIILWLEGDIISLLSPLAFIFVHFYNGEKGRMNKWIPYIFYPAHLIIFGIIGRWI